MQFQEAQLHDKITVREALNLFASFYEEPADVDALIDLARGAGEGARR